MADGALPDGLHRRADGSIGCWWHGDDDEYRRYHDDEWGQPAGSDVQLFEKACLEGFQAGLSWLTILRKRENFRSAFEGFDLETVAAYDEGDVERLMADAGIVRNRAKIEATINNAARAIEMIESDGSIAHFFWSFEPSPDARPSTLDHATLGALAQTDESKALSKELRRRGWKFVGPTTMYALMQAMGIVNDHLEGCDVRPVIEAARDAFTRPRCRRPSSSGGSGVG